jgi:tRNA modification GTPase
MERSRAEMAKADLLFLICDTTEGITDVEKNLLSKVQKEKVWIVWNKNDLKKEPVQEKQEHATFSVSALKSLGLEALQSALTQETVEKTSLSMEGGISNDRQREKLDAYLVSLSNAEAEWRRNSSPELVAFELRAAHQNLSRLLGKDEGAEDVLSEIFARFCIGK